MTIKRVLVCTICGQECSGANRFCAWQYPNTLVIRRWQHTVDTDRLNDEDTVHLCGQGCAHKLMDRFLGGTGKTEAGSATGEKEDEDGGEGKAI